MGPSRHAPFILALCTLTVASAGRCLRQSNTTSSDGLSEQQALLSFADKFANFQSVAADKHLQGWTASSNPPCSSGRPVERDSAGNCNPGTSAYVSADKNPWTGVTCNAAGKVTCIYLAALGIQGQLDGLADLSGLPSLAYLNLKSNKLTGTLPPALGNNLTSLIYIRLSYNSINSTLPVAWANESEFPLLQELHLTKNELNGMLPAEWGQSSAWPNLHVLAIAENNFYGEIPGNYSKTTGAFPALEDAVVSPGNAFCGAIPPEFPAIMETQEYITGPVYNNLSSFNQSCRIENGVIVPSPQSGIDDGLSSKAIAGIITGEVLFGLALLVVAGLFHRRYRWRQERSWVLFDWDVVQEPKPPSKSFNFSQRFAWIHRSPSSDKRHAEGEGGMRVSNGSPNDMVGGFGPLPLGEPPKAHSRNGSWSHGVADKDQNAAHENGFSRKISLPFQAWRDIMFEPNEVRLQQNADGSLRSLGNGSFGKVYKGVLQEGHECAVKVFENYTGERQRELLLSEISILRSCSNDNVVQFFGVVLQNNDIWMVMELMQGNLYRHLARGHHCTWYFRGRSIALDIAKGMHYLHTRHIIHMDLKSPNILVGETGIAKLADVGLARVMGSESFVSQVCAGTMHWMAPEVLVHGKCTEKADIFSFGVILWEICTGEAPSRGRMSSVSVPDECPQEVADLIEACMEEDPLKRPSALGIISKLQGIPVTSKPVPQPPWYAR